MADNDQFVSEVAEKATSQADRPAPDMRPICTQVSRHYRARITLGLKCVMIWAMPLAQIFTALGRAACGSPLPRTALSH